MLLLLALELLGRDVGGGRGLARFGRQLGEALGRRREAGRERRDLSLKREGERIILPVQAL